MHKFFNIKMLIFGLIVCACLFVIASQISTNWLRDILFYIGVFIGLVIFLSLLIFIQAYIPLTISYPGIQVKKKYQDYKTDTRILNTLLNSDKKQDIKFTIEDVYSEPNREATWKLHVYFTIYSNCLYDITIFDFHANVYCSEAFLAPPLTIGLRYYIELFETNSILAGGKTYQLKSNEEMPVEIVFEITRMEGMGNNTKPTFRF